jgi:hypothetical protein
MPNRRVSVLKKEQRYREIFLTPVRKCMTYKPKFGQGNSEKGVTMAEFKTLYGSDPFYSWVGLDTNLLYTAHRAAGGMTSVYRQLGIGCERLFRAILIDTTGYADPRSARWSYTTKTKAGKAKVLSLDGRLELSEIRNESVFTNLKKWISDYCTGLGDVTEPSNGIVFEVRQGYKSKDSKRQNADVDNATVAWANDYLPVFAVFSSQIDSDIVLRYRNNRCGILVGTTSSNAQISLYAFCTQVLGFDLAGFFKRQSATIKKEIHDVLSTLLGAEQ